MKSLGRIDLRGGMGGGVLEDGGDGPHHDPGTAITGTKDERRTGN